jgi:hypothetical protein
LYILPGNEELQPPQEEQEEHNEELKQEENDNSGNRNCPVLINKAVTSYLKFYPKIPPPT